MIATPRVSTRTWVPSRFQRTSGRTPASSSTQAEERRREEHDHERQREADPRIEGQREIGAQHVEDAVRDVDDPLQPEDDGQPGGEQDVDRPDGEAVEHLQQDGHRRHAEVPLEARAVARKLGRGSARGDAPLLEHVDVVGHREGGVHVLLDEEHGVGLALERVQRRHDGLDHRGGEALRGLVQDQELVAPDEGAGDGEHLLLAAGEAARRLTLPLGEPGKEREHALELRPATGAGPGAC